MVRYSIGKSQSGREFAVLLFAGDINVYSVARAFNEAYGVVVKCYGKYPGGPCANSAIIDYTANDRADEKDTFFRLACDFAEENKNRAVILMGCGDSYVELAAALKDMLPENVIAPYIDADLMHTLIHKEHFYEFCKRSGINYPDTFVHKKDMGSISELPFPAPFIIKPSNGIEYWKHPYPSQKKVYKADGIERLNQILSDIYGSGYEDSVIIQNLIPGDDSFMRVLTCYSDRSGKVKMMCLGHVLLEEHTPHGIGNHAVILTEKDEALMAAFRTMLDSIRFTGFSNFDIKFDSRDEKLKTFEINTRQGRSNYYVTGSGANIAKLVVEDRIDKTELEENFVDAESLWMVVPKRVAYKYVNKQYTKEMKRLIKAGKACNPLLNKLEKNPKKLYAVSKNLLSHYVKYRKYL